MFSEHPVVVPPAETPSQSWLSWGYGSLKNIASYVYEHSPIAAFSKGVTWLITNIVDEIRILVNGPEAREEEQPASRLGALLPRVSHFLLRTSSTLIVGFCLFQIYLIGTFDELLFLALYFTLDTIHKKWMAPRMSAQNAQKVFSVGLQLSMFFAKSMHMLSLSGVMRTLIGMGLSTVACQFLEKYYQALDQKIARRMEEVEDPETLRKLSFTSAEKTHAQVIFIPFVWRTYGTLCLLLDEFGMLDNVLFFLIYFFSKSIHERWIVPKISPRNARVWALAHSQTLLLPFFWLSYKAFRAFLDTNQPGSLYEPMFFDWQAAASDSALETTCPVPSGWWSNHSSAFFSSSVDQCFVLKDGASLTPQP